VSSSDSIIYDYASGDQLLSGYEEPATGRGTVHINSEDYFYKDIYLNGKKLIEGLNYLRDWGGQTTTILKTTFTETGQLLFSPRVNGNTPTGVFYFNAKTGVAVNHVSADFNIVSEQVWLNGLRQTENDDYMLVSKMGNLTNTNFISGFSEAIYENEGTFFNV